MPQVFSVGRGWGKAPQPTVDDFDGGLDQLPVGGHFEVWRLNWKEALVSLLKSLACADPIVYVYYLEAMRSAEPETEASRQPRGDDAGVGQLVDQVRPRVRATAVRSQ